MKEQWTGDQSKARNVIVDSWRLSKAPRPTIAGRIHSFANTINKRQGDTPLETLNDQRFNFFEKENDSRFRGSIDPMSIVVTLHGKLMDNIFRSLPVSDNGLLCSVFESYRRLTDENSKLRIQCKKDFVGRQAAEEDLVDAIEQWKTEEEDYKAEIKRLEVLIAHSNHGVEGVIRARQNSVIRRKKQSRIDDDLQSLEEIPETLQEFLTRTMSRPDPDLSGLLLLALRNPQELTH